MNTFNRKSLHAALAGLGALGATGAAQAVNVNPDGLGQVLIYPYFTTQGTNAPYNSLLSVVNSTNSGKVVKVRFLEGKFSHEVLDFNLWLSPKDVWTAAIVPTSIGGAPGAGISALDPWGRVGLTVDAVRRGVIVAGVLAWGCTHGAGDPTVPAIRATPF